jgi:soluble lytic murein transglycosylase-like protein
VSYAGAVGRTQILPSTAQYFMEKILSENDVKVFKTFGASDFSFAKDGKLSRSKKRVLAKEWLSDSENNIIMWGYIMRYNMSKTGNNIIKSLIAYNAGRGGLSLFMKRGNSIYKHEYVKLIYKRLARVDRKVS